jgi:hypothetical protein
LTGVRAAARSKNDGAGKSRDKAETLNAQAQAALADHRPNVFRKRVMNTVPVVKYC